MLFFRQIFDHRMESTRFKQFFDNECHICATTIKLISLMEKDKKAVPGILAALNISFQDYEDIKNADHCTPGIVEMLCRHLGIREPGLFRNCPIRPE